MQMRRQAAGDLHSTHSWVRWTALVSLLLFLLVSQAHALCEHNGPVGWPETEAKLRAGSDLKGDTATPADLCAVCAALHTAHPLPAFAVLPPGDRTAKPRAFVYSYTPETGWHAPLACRPPPVFA